jgi:L-fuconolactonase
MTVKIDAHQHFWQYSPETHPWIDDSMEVLRRDFLPEHLAPLLAATGFDGCVAVQAQQDEAETRWLLDLADQHDFVRGVVGWVDLRASDVRDRLRALTAHPRLRGVRHVLQDEPDGFMAREDFRRGIASLAEFGLTYDILIYGRQLPEAVDLTIAFPDQAFVLDHIGKPDIRGGAFDAWARGIAAVSRQRNVWCKLSGMVTEADWHGWSPEDFASYIDTVFDWFGPERTMVGSDWPVCTLAGAYEDVMAIALERIARLAPEDRAAVLGANAARFYRLDTSA